MALPTSHATLVDYIKARLGDPVITINVSNTQIDQRIDDAIAVWQDYHFDGSQTYYLKHKITASNLVFDSASTGPFTNNEVLVGATSNARGIVVNTGNTTFIQFKYQTKPVVDSFLVGESVSGVNSGASATINAVALGDYDNEYITTSNNVIAVSGILQTGGGVGGEKSSGLFSPIMQFVMSDIAALSGGGSALSYVLAKSNMEMLHDLFVGDIVVRFNRHESKLYMDIDWSCDIDVADWVVAEAQVLVDPNSTANVWSDRFLRDYATALVKKQWGQNLIKYQGVQMPGGVSVNGQAIYDEGTREATALEDRMQDKYSLPPRFIIS